MTCPITPGVQGILAGGNREGLEWLAIHAQTCPECQAEIERLRRKQAEQQENTAATVLKWLALAVQFFVMRGITDVFSETMRKAGSHGPFWRRK